MMLFEDFLYVIHLILIHNIFSMIYRIFGGITFILISLDAFGVPNLPKIVLGIFALVAGIALLAGI